MQINNSSVNPQLSSQVQSTDKSALVSNQGDRTRTKAENYQQQKEQTSSQQSRFDVDQQGLAQVEKFNQARNNQTASANAGKSGYDQPSLHNQLAVNSYRSVEAIAQRESIKQTFGVDLLA